LSNLLSKLTVVSCSFYIKFNVSALLLDDASYNVLLQKSSFFQLLLIRHWHFTR